VWNKIGIKKKMGVNNSQIADNFDQEAWCNQHRQSINPDDVMATFKFVKWRHPLFGCAKNIMPVLNGHESDADLAKLADAVTVLCVEQVGIECFAENKQDLLTNDLSTLNTTAIGNLAYVALNHSNKNIKNKASARLLLWRQAKISTPILR
jgi:hypothetical protein